MANEVENAFHLQQVLGSPPLQLAVRKWTSKQEMLTFLNQAAAPWRLLGEEQEHTTSFFTILTAAEGSAGIGISSIAGTLGPALVVVAPSFWMVGYNHDVMSLQLDSLKTVAHLRYQTPFYAFANDRLEEPYLAIFETGVVALDAHGQKLWECTSDIITRFERAGPRLLVGQLDGPDISIDVTSGRPDVGV